MDQRTNAQANPQAMFYGQPLTIEQVLASKRVADPLHVLEIVMPVAGGAALIIASKEVAARARKRAAYITGFGEHLAFKSPSYAADMLQTPIGPASRRAFEMAGLRPADVDAAQIYDCYTITALLTLEDAGFQVIEAVTQIAGEAGERQLERCDTVYVSGTGGVMSEQGALILQGA